MWNTIITLTSAGYGELYPKTFFGRIVGVIICFWGVLIISFFVVTVTNMLNFTPNEEKAYNLLMRLYYKTEMKKKAIGVLQSAFVYRNTKENEPNNLKLILSNFRTFRSHMIMFKKIARLVRSLDQSDGKDVDIMQTILENLMQNIEEMKEEQTNAVKDI